MDKEYIKDIIQSILNKEFPHNYKKREIVEYNDRFNFACPYCGDSAKNNYAKRGNLYLDNLFYVCFNCDKKTTFYKMCKDFEIVLDPSKKMEMTDYINNNMSFNDYADDIVNAKTDALINIDDLINAINTKDNINITDFTPIKKGGIVYNYLINRGIPPNLHKNIFQAKYWTKSSYQWVICILNRKDDNILGMQIRNILYGKKRMFKIYNYEALMNIVYPEKIKDIDETDLILYNKLSYFFNILNIDINHKITIFEGYLDSLFYPNSIGVVGVNTDMKLIENNNLDIQYLFDNDMAGFIKSEQKMKEGYPVFLWKKFFEDIIKKTNPKDPYKKMNDMSKIKDLNNLAQIVNNPYKSLSLDNYYSRDIFDIEYVKSKSSKNFSNKSFQF